MNKPNVPSQIANYGSPYVISKGNSWRFDDKVISWKSVGIENLLGKIECYQEACPCVYISVYEINDKSKVVRKYDECSRLTSSCELSFQEKDQWWQAKYVEGVLQDVIKIEPIVLPKDVNELSIHDDTGLLKSLSYTMKPYFG